MAAQTAGSSPAFAQVPPPLIQFSNVATDQGGNTLSGVVSITFSLYNAQQGGEPLWTETQNNIQLDPTGHYSVQLGVTKPNGVPTSLFTTGEARWLGVRIAEQAEQPHVLLVSVPYALKAGDSATVGGLPPSAFVLAAPANGVVSTYIPEPATAPNASSLAATDVTTTGGTANYLSVFNGTATIIDSAVFQSGTGSTAKIGIGTVTPASTLDVKGGTTVRGTLTLPATGPATATAGKNSQPLNLTASAYNSSTPAAANQVFQWQAEPAGNDTSTPSGTLNLLFGEGAAKPSETGLNIASNGRISFAPGQTFPGTGDGTVTSVATGLGLNGGPITTSGTLTIDPTVVPQLGTANTFTGNQTVNGNVSATGVVTGSGYQIGSNLFAFGSYLNSNAFLGFAGNTTMSGTANTASGNFALQSNAGGGSNTASGYLALTSNTNGSYDTASGSYALQVNTTGSYNTASGGYALYTTTAGSSNTGMGYGSGRTGDSTFVTGNNNTALGAYALFATGTLNNATAIGANAEVTASNALVLGSINGVNSATASTNVGIGTTAPISTLDVDANVKGLLGPTITLTNPGGGTGAGTSLDFNSYAPHTGQAGYNPAARIFAQDAGSWSDNLYFQSNVPGTYNDGLETNMVILSTGQVGIGTTAPDDLLSVNGNADKVGGGSWGTFSDGRLKNLNGNFNSGLSQVLKIHPVRYRYKPDNALGIHDSDEHVGVVAQDVQRVIPEAVTQNSKGYLLVNNDPIIWSMLNAIKEQQREIRALKSELRTTRRTLQKVQAQVAGTHAALVAAK